jgi:carbamoyl-phosphate synthase small subunit
LAVKIRDDGEMWGIITSKEVTKEKGLENIKAEKQKKHNYISNISVKEITNIYAPPQNSKGKIVIIDLGITKNITEQLKKLNFEIYLAPYNTSSEKILSLNPSGIIISNGPEEDISHTEIINNVKKLLGKTPILGISLGHLILAQALGGSAVKMKIGHRGVNYPVISPKSFKGEITVQNHGYIVNEKSINTNEINIEEINLNDKSIEKMRSEKYKFISTQYIPASPGFNEVNNIFYEFSDLLLKKGEFVHA